MFTRTRHNSDAMVATGLFFPCCENGILLYTFFLMLIWSLNNDIFLSRFFAADNPDSYMSARASRSSATEVIR